MSWEEAVWYSELGGVDRQVPGHLCPDAQGQLVSWGLLRSRIRGLNRPSMGHMVSTLRFPGGKKNLEDCTLHQALQSPAYEARQPVWPLRVSFLIWKAWRVVSTVFHQI